MTQHRVGAMSRTLTCTVSSHTSPKSSEHYFCCLCCLNEGKHMEPGHYAKFMDLHKCMCARVHTHAHMCTHTHARTHTRTHAHTRTHTHTHTHTYTHQASHPGAAVQDLPRRPLVFPPAAARGDPDAAHPLPHGLHGRCRQTPGWVRVMRLFSHTHKLKSC